MSTNSGVKLHYINHNIDDEIQQYESQNEIQRDLMQIYLVPQTDLQKQQQIYRPMKMDFGCSLQLQHKH